MAKTIRDIYGEALVKYGEHHKELVVLDADVASSTKSGMFAAAYPDRFFNVGIAEANMVAMAGGLAAVGKRPFANTFAVFLTSIGLTAARAFGSYSKLPIVLVGAYGGLSDAFDGPSHHSVEDISIMRSLPNFKVFMPCDAAQTDWLVRHAIEDRSPMYLRLSRDAFPDVYEPGAVFQEGRGNILRDGGDATIIACGMMVGQAMTAAQQLQSEGVNVRVVDMFSIKPLDKALVVRCAKETGAIITAEEHSILGGLGGAVAEALCEAAAVTPVGFVGMQDCHAECGPYNRLLHKYALDAEAIMAKVREIIKAKSL